MIENYRSDMVWRVMRKNPYLRDAACERAGFTRRLARPRRDEALGHAARAWRAAVLLFAFAAVSLAALPRAARRRDRAAASGRWAARAKWSSELLPEFERAHPGIRVEVQQLPWTAAHEKLLTAFAGDATPDLCQLGNTWVPEFAALGALAPLDALRRRLAGGRSPPTISAASGTPNVVGGALYGVPWYVDTRLLFYRRDLLAQRRLRGAAARLGRNGRAMLAAVKQRAGADRYASCCRSTNSSRCWRWRCSRTSRCCATAAAGAISAAPASAARCSSMSTCSAAAARRR